MGGPGRKTFVPKASLSPSAQVLDSVVTIMVLLSSPADHLTRLMHTDGSCACPGLTYWFLSLESQLSYL